MNNDGKNRNPAGFSAEKFQQTLKRDRDGLAPHRLAVAGEMVFHALGRAFFPAQAKQTVPTGFSGVPPLGPAIPVMASATCA